VESNIIHGKRERVNYEGAIYHITTNCNDRQNCLKDDTDFEQYRLILRRCKTKYGFLLPNYGTMHTHIHLIIKLALTLNISRIMQSINRQYAGWYNKRYNRKGHFWEERFYGVLIKDDLQLLAAMRYIDLNPVKANLCAHPAEWKYSGAACLLNGDYDELIDLPDVYLNLGNDAASRQAAYAQIFPPPYFNQVNQSGYSIRLNNQVEQPG